MENDFKGKLKKLVENDSLKEALALFIGHSNVRNKIIDIQNINGRLVDLEKKVNLNTISTQDAITERNKIREAILNIINENDEIIKQKRNVKFISYFISFILILGLGVCLYWIFQNRNLEFRNSDSYNILILNFSPYNGQDDISIENLIFDRIQKLSSENNFDIETLIDTNYNAETSPVDFNDAEIIGNKKFANLLVWGNYEKATSIDSTLINIKYLTTGQHGEEIFTSEKKDVILSKIKLLSTLVYGEVIGDIDDIVYWVFGLRNFWEENYDEAVTFFEQITPESKKQKIVLMQAISECLIQLNDYETATKYLLDILEEIPNNKIAINNLSYIYLNKGEFNKGLNFLEEKKEELKTTDDFISKNIEIIQSQINLKDKLYKNNKKKTDREEKIINGEHLTYEECLKNANNSFLNGKFETALEFYTKAIEIDSNNYKGYHLRGNYYMQVERDFEKALTDFSIATKINPNSYETILNIGVLYQTNKNYEKAIEYYDKVTEVYPKHPVPYYNRYLVYSDLGDSVLAKENLRKFEEFDNK